MKNNEKMVNRRKMINSKKIRRTVAFCMAAVMIFLTAPELFVQAAEETWKTVTDSTSVGSTIYAYGDKYLADQDGKTSLLDQNLEVICTYDSIVFYYEGYYKVREGSDVFIINADNQIVIPAGYDSIGYYNGASNYIVVGKGNKYGLINFNNETIISCSYDAIYTNSSTNTTGIVMVKNDVNYGLVNISNEIVVNIEYSALTYFSYNSNENVCYIGTKDGLKCAFDSMGNPIIALGEYTSISFAYNLGVISTQKNSKYGIVATNGTIILEAIYIRVDSYLKNVINYTIQDSNGVYNEYYIDKTGKKYDIPASSSFSYASDGYYKMNKKDGTIYYVTINDDGTLKYYGDGTYKDISYIGNNYFCITKGTEKAVMDASGTIIVPYQSTYTFSKSLSNEIFTIYKTSTVTNTTTGFTSNTNYYGIMNKSGKIVIPVIYSGISMSSVTGVISGYSNSSLSTVYFLLSDIASFSENYDATLKIEETGAFRVLKNEKFGVINSSLEVMIPLEYDMIIYIGDNNFKVLKNGKYGVIDSNGTVVKACIYTNIFTFNNSLKSISGLNTSNHFVTANTIIMYKSESIKDDSFRISDSKMNFTSKNTTKQLSITTETLNTSGLVWSSDNEGVATVSTTGLVTSVALGTAKITATLGSLTATSDVTVTSSKTGDVTLDNTIDIFDILAIQRHILGTEQITGIALTAADVTANSVVDIFDILAIQRHILGVENIE